jgi:hypothetical protein
MFGCKVCVRIVKATLCNAYHGLTWTKSDLEYNKSQRYKFLELDSGVTLNYITRGKDSTYRR